MAQKRAALPGHFGRKQHFGMTDMDGDPFRHAGNYGFFDGHHAVMRVRQIGADQRAEAETAFKAFGRALRMAVELDPRMLGVPSTKGSL